MTGAHDDDAQREMERRALRNVRGLVDRIEQDDKLGKRTQVRTFAILVGLVLALAIALAVAMALRGRDGAGSVLVDPPKPGQVMPQAPRAPQ
jgi:hypothetical protein